MPFMLVKNNNNYLNYVINKISPGYQIGNIFKYPAGNMFLAKVDGIKQAFSNKYVKMIKNNDAEKIFNIASYANEVAWLYFVKINGYFYKTIFKSV